MNFIGYDPTNAWEDDNNDRRLQRIRELIDDTQRYIERLQRDSSWARHQKPWRLMRLEYLAIHEAPSEYHSQLLEKLAAEIRDEDVIRETLRLERELRILG